MLKEARTEYRSIWLDEQQAILPIMTALFVDGLGLVQSRADSIADWFGRMPSAQEGIQMLRVPVQSESSVSIADWVEPCEARSGVLLQIPEPASSTSGGHHAAVRLLIRGISNQFNNLLMGIWGCATLIRMQLTDDNPLFAGMVQMERLIQSGAFLTHMVLGYLGERRNIAKRIRLNQLNHGNQKRNPGSWRQ
jgi:hypothetical protein